MFPGFDAFESLPGDVGRALAKQRRSRGLSQQAVAELMGTSQPAIARLENGATNARLSTLARYAEAIGCRLNVSLEGQ